MAISPKSKVEELQAELTSLEEIQAQMEKLKGQKRLLAVKAKIPFVMMELKDILNSDDCTPEKIEPTARKLLNFMAEQRRVLGVKGQKGRRVKQQ